jgi:hypothetical protein
MMLNGPPIAATDTVGILTSACLLGTELSIVQTGSTLTTFLFCMVKHPEVFKKAQEEIDRVIGNDRLVDYDDNESLPYFSAVLKEVLRWVRLFLCCLVPRKFGFITQPVVSRWGCPVPLGQNVSEWTCDISEPRFP